MHRRPDVNAFKKILNKKKMEKILEISKKCFTSFQKMVYSDDHKISCKGSEGDSVLKNPTERCGHRLRAASGGNKTIGNTPEPDARNKLQSRPSRVCALSIKESEKI